MAVKQELAKLLLDNYNNEGAIATEYSSLSKAEKDEKIRKALFEVLGTDTIKDDFHLAKLLNSKGKLVYSIIEEVITEGMIQGSYRNTFFDNFVEERSVDLGDNLLFYTEGNNQLQISKLAGNGATIDRQRVDAGKSFQVDLDTYGIAIYDYLARSLTGRCDFSKLVSLLYEAIDRGIREQTYKAFNDVLTALPTEVKYSGTYDKSAILKCIKHVESATGVKPQLVGTSIALSGLQDVSVLSDGMKGELNSRGHLSVWQGYSCLPVEQVYKAGTREFMFSDKDIYIVSGSEKPIKIVTQSGMIDPNTSIQYADQSMNLKYIFRLGIAVPVASLGLGKITISA